MKIQLQSPAHEKMMSAYQLLQEGTLNVDAFEHVLVLLKGIHPSLDTKLATCSRLFSVVQEMQNGDVITLSAQRLPEDTEEKRKRKKALLLFIESLKNLKSEIKRIDNEFSQAASTGNTPKSNLSAWGRIIGFAKGPFGIVTLIALIVVGVLLWQHRGFGYSAKSSMPAVSSQRASFMNVILYNGKQIPMSQLYVGHGPDCDSPHYHAVTGKVTTLDGVVIPDPEHCGYGRVKDVQVMQVQVSPGM